MTSDERSAKVSRLRELHGGPAMLVLPNAWDAASARVIADAGFPAVATTSGGVARAVGFEDGEQTPPEDMFAAVARIARSVDVPVTADLESGYGLDAATLVAEVAAAGVAGMNFEDTDHSTGALRAADSQAERIAAVREAASSGGDLVVNARVDVYVRGGIDPGDRLTAAVDRARRYFEAGADCVYPILMNDEGEISEFVAGVPGPANMLSTPAAPPLARLEELGVRRVTFGSGFASATLRHLAELLPDVGRTDPG